MLRTIVGACLVAGFVAPPTLATPCTTGLYPDVIVGDLVGTAKYGPVGDVTAFAIGTTSCNIGTCRVNWISSTPDHPVMNQNIYRLKGGRFEHIGQAWTKHGFSALQGNVCSTSCVGTSSSYLGVNCSDPYSASLNGSQTRMGPKFEVNAFTGVFPYPAWNQSQTGNAIYKRMQVKNPDLDPGLNAGALYFVESQYVAADDAAAGRGSNNASWRPITVSGVPGSGNYNIAMAGTTQRTEPAIFAWKRNDPAVTQTDAYVPGEGRYVVSAKATSLGGGLWNYEYAVYNLNSHRSAGAFLVPLPSGVIVTSTGFHDVDYHSGEPYSGADWDVGLVPGGIKWSTKSYDEDPNANALRWDTLYNFRFVANVAPSTGNVRIELFRPGAPSEISVSTVTPSQCNNNGICEPGETCAGCPSDCANQGGGTGCCGNAVCEPGESPCRCTMDCGAQTTTETSCNNGVDEDCDGLTDCADVDCCRNAACAASDVDGDTYGVLCDCDDLNPQVWATPEEVRNLLLAPDPPGGTALTWNAGTGGSLLHYDVLRTLVPSDFMTSAACLSLPDPAATTVNDSAAPPAGEAYFYLVRCKNACPAGMGTLGSNWSGVPRAGRYCP